jgi:uncharacterized protein with HEPN domain
MIKAIADVQQFTEGMELEAFSVDRKTQSAVAYKLMIIGEVAGLVSPELRQRYPEVPWSTIRGMRNVIIHDYPGVDQSVIWDTIQRDLPPVAHKLRTILEREA